MAVFFRDDSIVLGSDNSDVLAARLGELANKAAVVVGKLSERLAKRKHVAQETGDWRSLIGRGKHDDSVQVLVGRIKQRLPRNNTSHAMGDDVERIDRIVRGDPVQMGTESCGVVFDRPPPARIAKH